MHRLEPCLCGSPECYYCGSGPLPPICEECPDEGPRCWEHCKKLEDWYEELYLQERLDDLNPEL